MALFNKRFSNNTDKKDLIIEENQKPIKTFFEIMFNKFWELCKVNLLFFMFALPTVIWTYSNIQVILSITEKQSISFVLDVLYLFFLGLIPCIMIMGIALPSLNYITKSYAKCIHVFMSDDFFSKIKENWKQSLLYSFLLGAVIFMFYLGIRIYTLAIEQMLGAIYLRTALYIISAVALMTSLYAYPLMVSFRLKFKHIILNSVILTIGKLPQTTFIIVLSFLLPVLFVWLAFSWEYGIFILLIYFILLGFSLPAFIINSYTNHVFEKEMKERENTDNIVELDDRTDTDK